MPTKTFQRVLDPSLGVDAAREVKAQLRNDAHRFLLTESRRLGRRMEVQHYQDKVKGNLCVSQMRYAPVKRRTP